jgi:hypothetical protein
MIPNSSPAAKHTLCKTQIMRIKDELRFLHMKKQQITLKLYRLHLSLANTWGNSWHYIQGTIENKQQRIIWSKYKTLDDKLHRLAQQQQRRVDLLSVASRTALCQYKVIQCFVSLKFRLRVLK